MAEAAAAVQTAAKENTAAAKPKPAGPKIELSAPQKAAAVIIALGAEKASLLYRFMEDEDVEQLTLEVARLGVLSTQQTEEAVSYTNHRANETPQQRG